MRSVAESLDYFLRPETLEGDNQVRGFYFVLRFWLLDGVCVCARVCVTAWLVG